MINEMSIQTIKACYTELHNQTIQSKIETLIDKIYEADKAIHGLTSAEGVIAFLLQYETFCILHREHILNPTISPDQSIVNDATKLCNFGTDKLVELTEEIKKCRIDLNIGNRSVSALKGLGLIVAGIICAVFTVIVGVLSMAGASDPEVRATVGGIAGKTTTCFIEAFASFKETFTGKAECQELKDLASAVKKMNDDIARFAPQSKPFSIFAQQVKPSAPLSTPLANATHQQ